MQTLHRWAATAALALALAACGGSDGSPSPQPAPNTITFGGAMGAMYSPSTLTVHVGDTVTWQGDFGAHPLSSGGTCGTTDGMFGASSGNSYSFKFDTPGTYPYKCDVHCAMGMTGTVVVQ